MRRQRGKWGSPAPSRCRPPLFSLRSASIDVESRAGLVINQLIRYPADDSLDLPDVDKLSLPEKVPLMIRTAVPRLLRASRPATTFTQPILLHQNKAYPFATTRKMSDIKKIHTANACPRKFSITFLFLNLLVAVKLC
jgi:hypothetical protein